MMRMTQKTNSVTCCLNTDYTTCISVLINLAQLISARTTFKEKEKE